MGDDSLHGKKVGIALTSPLSKMVCTCPVEKAMCNSPDVLKTSFGMSWATTCVWSTG